LKIALNYKLIIVLLFICKILHAQEIRDEESLNYTFIGPVISIGYNQVEYTDWFNTSTETKKMSGYNFSGGVALNIFTNDLCGDFQWKYVYNQLDSSLTFMEFSIAGKYLYQLNKLISLGGGLGIYFQGPPSNRKYNGSAGLQIPLTAFYNISPDTKAFIDIYSRYGSFGIGNDTQSISTGINAGIIFKVGRI